MNILNLFKISIRAVANNKMRSFLSMLGIIIGVAAVIIMMSIGQGSKESIRKELSTMGTNLLTIRPGADMRGGVRQDPSSMQTLKMADYERILLLATALKLTLNKFVMFIIHYVHYDFCHDLAKFEQVRFCSRCSKSSFFNHRLALAAWLMPLLPT